MVIERVGDNSTDDWSGTIDTRSRSVVPTTNFGSDANMAIGRFSTGNYEFGYLAFPGLSNISSSATVNDTELSLYQEFNFEGDITHEFTFHRLFRDWVELELTFQIFSTGNGWQTDPGEGNSDRDNTNIMGVMTATAALEYKTLSSARQVVEAQGFIDGGFDNYGWTFDRTDGENDETFKSFTTSEGTDGQRPSFEVDFTVAAAGDINATVGTLTISGIDAVVGAGGDVVATTASLIISGLDSVIGTGGQITATTGTIEISGIDANIGAGGDIIATTGTITINGLDAVIGAGGDVVATLGTLTISGIDATVTAVVGVNINATTGAIVIAGIDAVVTSTAFISQGPGAFILDDLETFFNCDIELNLINDLDTFINMGEFAMTALYTAAGESAAEIEIIYNPEEIVIDPFTEEQTAIPPRAWAKTSDVPNVRHKDIIVVDSITYTVLKAFDNLGVTEITMKKV